MNLALSGSPGNNTVSAMSPTCASIWGVGTGDLIILFHPMYYLYEYVILLYYIIDII